MDTPIIVHLTDNDIYSFSVCYFYLHKFPRASGRYTFTDRNNTVYPPGFDTMLKKHLKAMEHITITDEEISFMKNKCYYFPIWFYTFLQGYRFNTDEVHIQQTADGRLNITIEGLLWKVVFWEVPILAIISELKHRIDGDIVHYDKDKEYIKSLDKAHRLIENGLWFAEFGTRRRFSFEHHDVIIRSLVETIDNHKGTGKFVGTSNLYYAMRYNLTPIGTMSHQVVSFCGAIFGYKEANFLAMDYWQEAFDSDLGIFLYDTYGWKVFKENFSKKHAKLFDGLRADSGNNFEAVDKIVARYEELTINPKTKMLTFSNGLTVDEAIAIHRYCNGKIMDTYGIGTHLTCDITAVEPMNIVIKLTEARITERKNWQKAIKLSDDPGKYAGDPSEVRLAKTMLGIK